MCVDESKGYLRVTLGTGMYEKAHRLVLWQMQGPPPGDVALPLLDQTGSRVMDAYKAPNKCCAMHTCNNKRCLNPAHLVWATHGDNRKGNNEPGMDVWTDLNTGGMRAVSIELNV